MNETLDMITLPYEAIVRQIAEPLKKYNITYFTLDKKYTDGFTIRLSTEGKWIKLYLDLQYDKIGAFELNPAVYQSGYALWSELKQDPVYLTVAKEFKISHGITLIRKKHDACEFYNFGANVDNNSIVEFYLSNIDILEKFSLLFRERMNAVIAEIRKKFLLFKGNKGLKKSIVDSEKNHSLLEDIKKYYFYMSGKVHYLTRREFDFLKTLKLGKTAEEIGLILNISNRTCENHIQCLKKKLLCKSLFELGFKFGSLEFCEILGNTHE